VTEGARELENSRQCNFLFETQKIIEDMTIAKNKPQQKTKKRCIQIKTKK
jgi:hypothetical protein